MWGGVVWFRLKGRLLSGGRELLFWCCTVVHATRDFSIVVQYWLGGAFRKCQEEYFCIRELQSTYQWLLRAVSRVYACILYSRIPKYTSVVVTCNVACTCMLLVFANTKIHIGDCYVQCRVYMHAFWYSRIPKYTLVVVMWNIACTCMNFRFVLWNSYLYAVPLAMSNLATVSKMWFSVA